MDREDELARRALEGGWIERPEAAEDCAEDGPPPEAGARYEVLAPIGAGGMGRVVRARDRELGRDVAIKFVAPRGPIDLLADRMLREARILSPLEHPNIVRTYDIGRNAAGDVFFVMQLIEGRSLAEALAAGDLPLVRRLSMFLEVCRALAYAHERGVVHRDLKPRNILVGPQGEVYVADWGLATFAGEVSTGTAPLAPGVATREGWGTPGYAAPEQREGHPVDLRTDVFALGMVLAEIVTLRAPVVLLGPSLSDDTPRELAAIVRRATQEDPELRYPSVTLLAEDVLSYLEGRPGRAWREGPLRWSVKWVRRHRAQSVALALGIAFAAMAVLWSMREQEFRLSRAASEAIARADVALRDWRARRYFPRHDVTAFRAGLEAAVTDLERALTLQPEADRVWATLGWVHLVLGRPAKARPALEHALASSPSEGTWRWWLARTYAELGVRARANPADERGWYAKAVVELRRALVSPTWRGEPWERELALVWLMMREGKVAEAIDRCERQASHFPQGGEELLWLAGTEAEGFERRLALLESAAEMAPSWARAHAYAAMAAASVGSAMQEHGESLRAIEETYRSALGHGEAAAEIDRGAIEALTGRASARLNLACLMLVTGRDPSELLGKAIEDYSAAIAIEPNHEEVWSSRGDARANLAQVLSRMKKDPCELYRLAVEEDYTHALVLNPTDAETLSFRGGARIDWALALEERGEDVRLHFRKAIEEDLEPAARLSPGSARALTTLGYAHYQEARYLARGKLEGSRKALERSDAAYTAALEADERFLEALWRRGAARLEMGRARDAVSDFEAAIQADPSLRGFLAPLLDRARAEVPDDGS